MWACGRMNLTRIGRNYSVLDSPYNPLAPMGSRGRISGMALEFTRPCPQAIQTCSIKCEA